MLMIIKMMLIMMLIRMNKFKIICYKSLSLKSLKSLKCSSILLLLLFSNFIIIVNADWESWWTYEGISGPDFWGRLNPRWSHCSKGQRQSPIDIDTASILYDPLLEPIKINGDYIKGRLINTGRGISLMVEHQQSGNDKFVTFMNGPFSYQYTLSNITLHFGRENDRGSEHTIDGKRFPGELQLYAYNSQLYSNWSEAKREPNGLIAISIFIMVTKQTISNSDVYEYGTGGDTDSKHHHHHHHHQHHHQQQQQPNAGLKYITGLLKNITKRGLSYPIESISIMDLLPSSWQYYVTYDGSMTQPACHETVQWVILNKPIYLSSYQFHMLRHSLKGDGHQDNFRPVQPINKRSLRSNIVQQQSSYSNTVNSNSNSDNYKIIQRKKSSKSTSTTPETSINIVTSDEIMDRKISQEEKEKLEGYQNEQQNDLQMMTMMMVNDEQFNNDNDIYQSSGSSWKQSKNQQPVLMSVKDPKLCLPDQIRLYGYRANPKLINEEL